MLRIVAVASAVAACAVIPQPTSASAAEEVGNGTFESGTGGWYVTPGSDGSAPAPLAQVSTAHSGGYAALVSNTRSSAATTVLNDSPNSVAATVAGATYKATAWVRARQTNTALTLRLIEFNAGDSALARAEKYLWATDTSWHQLAITLTAKASGSTIDVNVLSNSLAAGKSFLVDDVSVTSSTTTTTPSDPPATPSTSTAASRTLPTQGSGAMFGYYQAGGADPRPMESKIGRKFDLIHHFKDFDASHMWPNSAMLSQASEGRVIHVGWEMTDYSGVYDSSLEPAPASGTTDRSGDYKKTWTYKQVINGSLDKYLDKVAAGVKAAPSAKFIVDYDPEMDDRPDIGGTAKLRQVAGTRAEYAAAFRHIVDRFRARGVTNVVWSFTMSGWYADEPSRVWSLQQLWPGAGYVDMIMWDPYNHSSSNWKSFAQIVAPTYNAVRSGATFDKVDTSAKKLPLGLAEYGCIDDSRRADWLKAIPSQAKQYPALVSLGYFSSGSWGALHNDATDTAAFGVAGQNWYLNP